MKNFSSSGVFSNYFSAPSYQSSTLSSWFATHDPGYPSWVFNRSGRGFPDVSASSVNFTTAYRGNFTLEDGTSAAAPIWGSIINLINEQRLRGGKGPVGFINPVLYLYPEVLNDVTEGSNANCHSSGFEAVKGWDPVCRHHFCRRLSSTFPARFRSDDQLHWLTIRTGDWAGHAEFPKAARFVHESPVKRL